MAMLYETISAELENKMQNGELSVGDRLSERQLSEKYGVSRTVIREAMRSLAEKGLVETVCGKGNFVTKPGEEKFVSNLSGYMDNSDIPIADVAQARKIIECSMVPNIIENIDESTTNHLEQLIRKMEENRENVRMSANLDEEFHLVMQGCANNMTLILLLKTLNKITNRLTLFENKRARTGAIEEHKSMLEAIKKHDANELRELIAFHIDTLCEYL